MTCTLEAVALERHLPTVLAPQSVDEGRRRTHHPDALDPVLQEAARDRVRGLARRRGGAAVLTICASQHCQLRVGRKHERPARWKLRVVEALVVARLRAAER